jgi:hypothetical protein
MEKITVQLIDDLDGESEAVETVSFSLDGVEYAIDLNDNNAAHLRGQLLGYIEKARKVKGHRKASGQKVAPAGATREMREWLRAQGHHVKDRGRVPADLVNLWQNRPSGGDNGVLKSEAVRDVEVSVPQVPESNVVVEMDKPKKTTRTRKAPTKKDTTTSTLRVIPAKKASGPAKPVVEFSDDSVTEPKPKGTRTRGVRTTTSETK